MENIILIITSLMANPLYLGITIYTLGVLVQSLISAYFIRKRRTILIEEFGFPQHRLVRLWVFSSLAFPISWYYGIKAMYNGIKMWNRRRKNPVEEDWDEGREYDDHYTEDE